MRQHLANLALCFLVGGCSLIYNAGNIPAVSHDAELADSPFDANPAMLTLAAVSPASIVEGTGDGGSLPTVLVIQGTNFVVGAQVTITGATTVTADNTMVTVTQDSTYLAVPLKSLVDPSVADGTSVGLTVQVTQPIAGGGTAMQTIAGPMLHGLDELTGSAPATPKAEYSQIMLSDVTIAPVATMSAPYILRASATVQIGNVTAKGGAASGTAGGQAGPGGCAGGNAQAGGGCGANGGAVGANGSSLLGEGGNGGGGGFATAGATSTGTGNAGNGMGGGSAGDDVITDYTKNTPGGGGGGGQNNVALGNNGGGGGGAGAVVELTAGGDLTVGTIDVTGGVGAKGTGGGGGGGGAGGAIVLRCGHTLTNGALTAAGGAGGASSAGSDGTGGAGSVGRIRWNNPTGSVGNATPTAVRGASFVSPPTVITSTTTSLQIVGTAAHMVNVAVFDGTGANTGGLQNITFDGSGNASFVPPLTTGFNRVCVVPSTGGGPGHPESQECVDVAYLP